MEFSHQEPIQHYHHTNEFDMNANLPQSQPESDNKTSSENLLNQSGQSDLVTPQKQSSSSHIKQPSLHHPTPQNHQNVQQPTPMPHNQHGASSHSHHQHGHHSSSYSQYNQQIPNSQQQQKEQQIQREPLYQRHGYTHRHPEQVHLCYINILFNFFLDMFKYSFAIM